MISRLLASIRLDRQIILIALASLVVVIGLGRFGVGQYKEKLLDIETKEATLFGQQKNVRKLPTLKKQVAILGREVEKANRALFHGQSEDEVTSAMQIRIQGLITGAGLEPESLRPLGGSRDEGPISSINIKVRLGGTLDQFANFLASLYKNDTFFLIKSCTIKPDKLKGVKVFLDLKAFYRLDKKAGSASRSAAKRTGRTR